MYVKIVFYHLPNKRDALFFEEYFDVLAENLQTNIVVEDFNFDCYKSTYYVNKKYKHIMYQNGCTHIVNKLTRRKLCSLTLIDHIIINEKAIKSEALQTHPL